MEEKTGHAGIHHEATNGGGVSILAGCHEVCVSGLYRIESLLWAQGLRRIVS